MTRNLFKSILGLKGALLVVVVFLCFPISSQAQNNYTPSELDTLVSSVALYPDPLLVHVLTASTYGNQLAAASAWAEGHKHLKGESLSTAIEEANLPYDPSVQALLPFPSVLSMMAKYSTWTDQLGDAVTTQKDDVMEAIQRMRQSAYDHGHLKTNEQVTVQETSGNIAIEPVKTEVIYVPVYNPRIVYYVYADGYTRISYGTGVWLGTWYGEWGWGSCWFDWGPRVIYVRNTRWYAHRPIPHHPHRYRPPPRHGPGMPPPGMQPPHRHLNPGPAPAPAARKASLQSAPSRPVSNVGPSPAPAPSAAKTRSAGPADIRTFSATAPKAERASVNPRPASTSASAPAPASRPAPAPAPIYNSQDDEEYGSFGKATPSRSTPSVRSTSTSRNSTSSTRSTGSSNRNSGSSRSSGGGFGKAVRR